jgi:polyhydroxybutyrate depolymerase
MRPANVHHSARRAAVRLGIVALFAGSPVMVSTNAATAGDDGGPREWAKVCNDTADTIGTPYAEGLNCRLVDIDGTTRRFVAYVPNAVAESDDSVPVVLMLHGSSGRGEQFYKISGWREVADDEGLIAVFPTSGAYRITGTRRNSTKWHSFDLACVVEEHITPLQDDVAFIDAVIDDVTGSEQIDGDRVYASGFSSGAQMAQRLAVERGNRFAAVASSAGFVDECPDGPPTDRIPTPSAQPAPAWANLGSRDDRALAAGARELSLEPAEILEYWDGAIDRSTAAQGLDSDEHTELDFATWSDWTKPVPSWPDAQWTVLQWNTLDTGNEPTEFVFSILKGVDHHFPAAELGRPPKSAYVNLAEVFWLWFETYTLD